MYSKKCKHPKTRTILEKEGFNVLSFLLSEVKN